MLVRGLIFAASEQMGQQILADRSLVRNPLVSKSAHPIEVPGAGTDCAMEFDLEAIEFEEEELNKSELLATTDE